MKMHVITPGNIQSNEKQQTFTFDKLLFWFGNKFISQCLLSAMRKELCPFV